METPTIDLMPLMLEFSEVFHVDLVGMPPDRDISFGIELSLGT